jgi:hypothetical protein
MVSNLQSLPLMRKSFFYGWGRDGDCLAAAPEPSRAHPGTLPHRADTQPTMLVDKLFPHSNRVGERRSPFQIAKLLSSLPMSPG